MSTPFRPTEVRPTGLRTSEPPPTVVAPYPSSVSPDPAAGAPVDPTTTRFADLPTSPPAYHEGDHAEDQHGGSRGRSSTHRRGRSVSPLERLLYVAGGVLAVLVVAKAIADATDLDTNVFDALLYAMLAMVVGVVVVGVGGGLIGPMRARWQRVLER